MTMKRRDFLKRSALLAAAAVSLPRQLRSAATPESKRYDIIIVGAGAAGAIVARRLVDRFPEKSILLIEAGGPTSKIVGGKDFPPYDTEATIFDVPGEYQNIAFQPKGDPYRQKETPFTYQGMGYGGNSQFNGMLFQAAPPFDFQKNWPRGWKYQDLQPYFDLVLREMAVSDTPSPNGAFYNEGSAEIFGDIYQANGFREVNTTVLGGLGDRYFSHAYVVSKDGLRGGPVRSHLAGIIGRDGESSRAKFDVIAFAKVQRIVFDDLDRNKAVGVEYIAQQRPQATTNVATNFVPLADKGKIILAGGALMTPRLLLLSGVGPFNKHDEIFNDGFSVPFHINNPGIGTSLFDHVGTMLNYEYTGSTPFYEAYHYSDYAANGEDLAQYASARSGPYAQYGPVSVMQRYLRRGWRGRRLLRAERPSRQPNVEIFVNPFGAGAPGGTYNGPKNVSAFAMLLRPRKRGLLGIDKDGFVDYPPIYLTSKKDLQLMAASIQQLLFLAREDPNLALTFGPGGRSHPDLNPDKFKDVREYVAGDEPIDGIFYTRLIMNHWGGSCPLRNGGRKGVDPSTLLVKGTQNIHVVDASLHPAPLSAHPVATIMAVAEKASDVLSGQLSTP